MDVAHNHIACARALASGLQTLPELRLLHVKGNPMHLQRDYLVALRELVPERVRLDVAVTPRALLKAGASSSVQRMHNPDSLE